MSESGVCKLHSGVCSEVGHLKDSDLAQWREINGMKKIMLSTLGAIIVTLIAALTNLCITMSKLP